MFFLRHVICKYFLYRPPTQIHWGIIDKSSYIHLRCVAWLFYAQRDYKRITPVKLEYIYHLVTDVFIFGNNIYDIQSQDI